MKIYICNALALGMLDRAVQSRGFDNRATQGIPRIPTPISLEQARKMVAPTVEGKSMPVEIVPAVGHMDTARVIADQLGLPVEKVYARVTVRLKGGFEEPYDRLEMALIGAYTGPRLPEGATKLPEGAAIEWWVV
jgi:hypothetical protein